MTAPYIPPNYWGPTGGMPGGLPPILQGGGYGGGGGMPAPFTPQGLNLSESEILKRVSSGKDARRAASADALIARAKAGDPAAIAQFNQAAMDQGGWATNDAVNYLRLRGGQAGLDLSHLDAGGGFIEPRDGGGFVGSLGGVLKTVAPFAGLIPGVGPFLGAGLAAGGSALGGALHGDKFSLLNTALAGGAGYLGGKLNPFGSHAGSGLQAASGLGNATQSGAGAGQGALSQIGNAGIGALPESAYESFPGLPGGWTDAGMSAGAMGGGGGGGNRSILDRILGGGGDGGGGGGGLLDKIFQYGVPILGGIGNAHRQHEADQMMQNAVAGANQEWASRQPLRDFSMQGILGLPSIRAPDLSSAFADPGNPYYRPLGG